MKQVQYAISIIEAENAEVPHFRIKLGDRQIGTIHKEGTLWFPMSMPRDTPIYCEPKLRKTLAALELVGKFICGD